MGGEPARKAGSPRWEKRPHPAREPRGAVATSLLSPPGSQRLSCREAAPRESQPGPFAVNSPLIEGGLFTRELAPLVDEPLLLLLLLKIK